MDIPATLIKNAQEPISKPKKAKVNKKILTFFTVFFGTLIFIATFLFFFLYLPAKSILKQVDEAKAVATTLKQSINDKDLALSKTGLENLNQQLVLIDNKFKKLSYLSFVPIANNYYKDGQSLLKIGKDALETGDIVIKAIEPYQDFLGLKGAATSSAKTTEDRIAFLTESIESLLPHLDSIDSKVTEIDTLINQIDITRYPETIKDIPLRHDFNQIKESIGQAKKLISDGKPILTKTSWLLGKDKVRNYLVIFQNDGELRPSGGFWTAYTTIKVDKGKIIPGTSSNIYDLDDKISSTVLAPRLIKSYHINVPYLNLRDSNLSPDFPTDAQVFLDGYYKAMGKKTVFDAVVALDTNVLVDIVKVLGKLDTTVGTFTADPDPRCSGCPKIIYDLEWIAGRPRNYIEKDRKGFLGPLMHALLANAMGSEKSKMAPLAQAFFNNIFQKHILFFFTDTEVQKAAELANIAGQIVQTDSNTDYFHLNDANFASAKSNIFITQKIKHEISKNNDNVEHKVTITYTNPAKASNCNLEKGDLCLNAPTYRNLFRFYLPLGSQLIKMTGSEVEVVKYEENNKQVFEGFYGNKYPLYAMSNTKVSIQYTSPIKASKNYNLYLQKQPGTKAVEYEVYVNGQKQESFSWVADKNLRLSL
ncbi:MAG TPA: DUF4012 domain-containing protein [Candidatus Methanoperedens sp.]|nr:DUF4012 domain-containing protein [Candidatus Methanoperedens sp.]